MLLENALREYRQGVEIIASHHHQKNGCQFTITARMLVQGEMVNVHVKVYRYGSTYRREVAANKILQHHLDCIGTLDGKKLVTIPMIDAFTAPVIVNRREKQYGFVVLKGMYDEFVEAKSLPNRIETLRRLQEKLAAHPEMDAFEMDLDGINVELVNGELLVFDVQVKTTQQWNSPTHTTIEPIIEESISRALQF